jgi:hypothetical protein
MSARKQQRPPIEPCGRGVVPSPYGSATTVATLLLVSSAKTPRWPLVAARRRCFLFSTMRRAKTVLPNRRDADGTVCVPPNRIGQISAAPFQFGCRQLIAKRGREFENRWICFWVRSRNLALWRFATCRSLLLHNLIDQLKSIG